ncbi:MAG: glycosyltransferase family 4 protein [Acidimicrobiia bacterium]
MSAPAVLYVLKRFPRLSETFILNELLALQGRKVRVGVDSLRLPEPGPKHPELDLLSASVRYPSAGGAGAASEVAARAVSEGFDLIHAHFATSAAGVALEAGRLAGLPVTITAHAKDIFHDDYAVDLGQRLAGAARLITVSEHNRRHLEGLLPGIPVTVVYNGIAPAPAFMRDPNGPVLCIGRLVEKKGIDTLIAAAGLLAAAGTPTPIEIIGGGPEEARLKRLARELGPVVRFLGSLTSDQVNQAFRRASLVAIPCRIAANGDRDGMPTVLGEAMVRGLPVISTDLVGIPELVQHLQTGWLVPPNDPAALAMAIRALRTDPGLADALAAKGAAHATELLDPARAIQALISTWEMVAC